MFPTEMLETRTQRQILRILAEKNKRYTIPELAEMCHRSESTISRSLRHSDRYPFVAKHRVPGSKQLAFELDFDSEYATAIREFFRVERRRERKDGTIPVDVWNLLENVADRLSSSVDALVEVFLFGSYATGEYYAGSDVDLLVVHASDERTVKRQIEEQLHKLEGGKNIHVIPVTVSNQVASEGSDEDVLQAVRMAGPVGSVDTLVPLIGEVKTT